MCQSINYRNFSPNYLHFGNQLQIILNAYVQKLPSVKITLILDDFMVQRKLVATDMMLDVSCVLIPLQCV